MLVYIEYDNLMLGFIENSIVKLYLLALVFSFDCWIPVYLIPVSYLS